jgi:hypothetical protein
MKLEVRIHISPTPHFFRQVEYIWRAFTAAGGYTAGAIIKVFVGEDCEPYDLYEVNPWSRGRIQWHWADREEFRRLRYGVPERFRANVDGDYILFLDADTLLIQPIDELLESLMAQQTVAGVMSHNPPFHGLPYGWQNVFDAIGAPMPRDRFEHTGYRLLWNLPQHRFGPVYYNFGVVFVPGGYMRALGAAYIRQMDRAAKAPIVPYFRGQLSMTLAIYELDLPRVALGVRYNFPNYPVFDRAWLSELQDVRIIHYLSEDILGTRRDVWGSDEMFNQFLSRKDLKGSNEIVRARAAALAGMNVTALAG